MSIIVSLHRQIPFQRIFSGMAKTVHSPLVFRSFIRSLNAREAANSLGMAGPILRKEFYPHPPHPTFPAPHLAVISSLSISSKIVGN